MLFGQPHSHIAAFQSFLWRTLPLKKNKTTTYVQPQPQSIWHHHFDKSIINVKINWQKSTLDVCFMHKKQKSTYMVHAMLHVLGCKVEPYGGLNIIYSYSVGSMQKQLNQKEGEHTCTETDWSCKSFFNGNTIDSLLKWPALRFWLCYVSKHQNEGNQPKLWLKYWLRLQTLTDREMFLKQVHAAIHIIADSWFNESTIRLNACNHVNRSL